MSGRQSGGGGGEVLANHHMHQLLDVKLVWTVCKIVCSNFCRLRHAHVRKDTRLSLSLVRGSMGTRMVCIHVRKLKLNVCTKISEQKNHQWEDGLSQEVVRELVVNGFTPSPEMEGVTGSEGAIAHYASVISANYHRAECKRQQDTQL